MSWRVVIISNRSKLSYKDGYMLIRGDCLNTVHLSELGTLIIDTTEVSITSHLMCELVENKTKIIFCNEKHIPISEIIPYYNCHNSTKRILAQINWNNDIQKQVWTEIVKQKITNQSSLLKKLNISKHTLLESYVAQVENYDITNREGHAAKVYFNELFGKDFNRNINNNINAGLNYGYSIILSSFNKELAKNGILTQLGIWHKSEFNHFNLSYDLLEPFRIIVDECVYNNKDKSFDLEFRSILADLLNKQIEINNKIYHLSNAIEIYTRSVLDTLENQNIKKLCKYIFT